MDNEGIKMPCHFNYGPSEKAIEKATDIALEGHKQLITMSGALLALTITFIKDFLGSSATHSNVFFLVPVGWVMLTISLWYTWAAIADGAKFLGRGMCEGYVFRSGPPRWWGRIGQWTFFLGLICLIGFATSNFYLPRTEAAVSAAPSK